MIPARLIENLDCSWSDDLLAYATRIEAWAKTSADAEAIETAHKLSAYARGKAKAMKLRKRCEIARAMWVESVCDSIYHSLPRYAQW